MAFVPRRRARNARGDSLGKTYRQVLPLGSGTSFGAIQHHDHRRLAPRLTGAGADPGLGLALDRGDPFRAGFELTGDFSQTLLVHFNPVATELRFRAANQPSPASGARTARPEWRSDRRAADAGERGSAANPDRTSGVPPAPELVIFDCDGVLVDSEPLSNTVLATALTRAGLPTSPAEAIATYKGRHIKDVLAIAEQRLGHPLPGDFVATFERERNDVFGRELTATPGAAQAVQAVRDAGIAVCVASQGRREKTELTLGLTGLRGLFGPEAVFSAHSVARGKPHPDLFLHAAAAMGVAPARAAVVEDTAIGVRAARAAAMRAIGYPAAGDVEALREAGAEVILDLADLPARLGSASSGSRLRLEP